MPEFTEGKKRDGGGGCSGQETRQVFFYPQLSSEPSKIIEGQLNKKFVEHHTQFSEIPATIMSYWGVLLVISEDCI